MDIGVWMLEAGSEDGKWRMDPDYVQLPFSNFRSNLQFPTTYFYFPMSLYHRHSFFPLVLICLTLVLAIFMFLTLSRVSDDSQQQPSVDSKIYEEQLLQLLTKVENGISIGSLEEQQSLVETALSELLAMRVPVEYKNVHLSAALLLNKMLVGYRTGEIVVDEWVAEIGKLMEHVK